MESLERSPASEPNTPSPPAAYCRDCGRALSAEEVRNYQGVIYCPDHAPSAGRTATGAPPLAMGKVAADPNISPGLAFLLGLIPGVGAIYNGQYGKGFVHVLITGLLFSLAEAETGPFETLFGLLIPVWFFYMAFEAFHTAKRRASGQPVDEFSSIFPNSAVLSSPLLPVLLIALGVIILLHNVGFLNIRRLIPYIGPIFLISLGAYLLYVRARANATLPSAQEAENERR